jgi:hypothetical protein
MEELRYLPYSFAYLTPCKIIWINALLSKVTLPQYHPMTSNLSALKNSNGSLVTSPSCFCIFYYNYYYKMFPEDEKFWQTWAVLVFLSLVYKFLWWTICKWNLLQTLLSEHSHVRKGKFCPICMSCQIRFT